MYFARAAAFVILTASPAFAQTTNDPFSAPIPAAEAVITVNFVEFATLPDLGDQQPARMMLLVDEPGTGRLFVNDMRGPLYTVGRDGKAVALYVNINAPNWGVNVNSTGNERGFQSFAFHPQFNRAGTPGFGKFYTYTDTANMTAVGDFRPGGDAKRTHDTVLLEWTAKNPAAAAYDGGAPRLGWNDWEGSFRYISREAVNLADPRSDKKMAYPIVEYGQPDPLLQSQSAVTMGSVYRQKAIPQLTNLLLFGDNPSGEVFCRRAQTSASVKARTARSFC